MLKMLICLVWAAVLLAFLRGIVNHLPVISDHTESVIAAVVVITLLFALPALVNKFCLADYLFFIAWIVYYLSCYIFYPDNASYLDENAYLCLLCVFPYYFIGRIVDIDEMFNVFVLLSTACIFFNLFYFLVYAQEAKNMAEVAGNDNMYTAYRVLPHVSMLLWATLEKFRLWKAATLVLGILFLLSCGTRGPLVCLAFFGVIYFFFYMNFKGAAYIKIGIVTTFIIIIANLNTIILFLVKTFTGLQLSTRILEKFVMGDLGNDTYRSVLREKLYDVLDTGNHFFGLGAFGCQNYGVIYPHYLPLDFYCTYGYFWGGCLLLLLFALIVYALWVARGKKAQVFIVFLFSVSIIKLMFTGTFINEPYLFMLIGACAKILLTGNESSSLQKESL